MSEPLWRKHVTPEEAAEIARIDATMAEIVAARRQLRFDRQSITNRAAQRSLYDRRKSQQDETTRNILSVDDAVRTR